MKEVGGGKAGRRATGKGRLGGGNGEGEERNEEGETLRGRRGVGDQEGDEGEGGNGVGEMERGATGRGRWGEEMGRGDGDGGNGKGEMRRGKRKGETGKLAKGRGRTRGKRKGDFTDGYEMLGWTYGMPVWNEVTELFDFVYPCNAGYPS